MADAARVAEAREALWAAIEAREGELVGLVGDLVRFPSVLGQEAGVQGYVADHLRNSGLETAVWDLDESLLGVPEAGSSGVPFAGRPNVAGVRRGAGGGRSLIMQGHVDVVSPEPVAAWTRDPWGAEISGGRMWGRGAFDMKSGHAINLLLPRLLRDAGIGLKGDLTVQSVIEEECTGNGALDMCRRYRADAALITESTSGRFIAAHVGVMWFRVAVSGRAAHAAYAHTGVNAIDKMVPVIRALRGLEVELNRESHPAFDGIDHPINLNIGTIHGGDWPSSVPGLCELHCRVSFFPGQSAAEMGARIEAAVAAAAREDDWLREHPPAVSYDGFRSGGSVVSMDEPWIRLLAEWHARLRGDPLVPIAGTGTNDMRYYNFAGMPGGCYGCTGDRAHGADEWLDLASLVPTAKTVGAFLLDWCGVA